MSKILNFNPRKPMLLDEPLLPKVAWVKSMYRPEKVYWVNIYKYPWSDVQWFSDHHQVYLTALANARVTGHCIGRWKVTLK